MDSNKTSRRDFLARSAASLAALASRPLGAPDAPPIEVTVWDVPGLNFVVKRITHHRNRPGTGEHIELVSLRQGGRRG